MLNFSNLINLFNLMKLKVYGPYTQRDFFTSIGIEDLKDKILKKTSTKEKEIIENSLNKLLHINKMGQMFKVLIIASHKINYYE